MKNTIRIATVAMALLLCLGAFVGCGKKNYTDNNTEFVIGASGPLTGGASVYGLAVKNSAQMAVDEINANGGLNGVKFKFIMMDDEHKAENVTSNYNTMYEQGMQVSLACVTSNPCLEWKALSKEDNLFFITPSATADAVREYSNGFQMCFADTKQGVNAADFVNGIYKGQTIGMLYRSDDAYSTGIRENFLASLDSSITVVEASFSGEVVASFASQIELLKNCKFIFMPIYYTPAAQFMDEAKNTIAKDAVYYGCDGFDGIDTSVEGFDISKIPQEVSYLSHFNSAATEGAPAEFIKKYTEKFGSETLNQFGAAAYDCVYAIYNAMKLAGDKITVTSNPSDICNALVEIFNGGFEYTTPGVTGSSIKWTNDGFVNKEALKFVVKEATK